MRGLWGMEEAGCAKEEGALAFSQEATNTSVGCESATAINMPIPHRITPSSPCGMKTQE